MAKKIITPEEYKTKQTKKVAKRKRFFDAFLKTLALCLAIALVYSATTIAYTRMEMLKAGVSTNAGANANTGSNSGLKDGFEDNSSDNSGATNNDAATNNGASNGDSATSAADQEILDMFKKGLTAARTSSTSVIRVKDGATNYKNHVKAGGLSDAAKSLMGMFMVGSKEEIEAKNEDWDKTKLPDPTALTLNGVQKITREDKGSTYVITVVAKDATNPKTGADGIGSIAGVIEESQITGSISSVPGLQLSNINIKYENVTAVATIDKATGNCIALELDAPCVLCLDAKLLVVSIDGAEVGIEVFTEYKISY